MSATFSTVKKLLESGSSVIEADHIEAAFAMDRPFDPTASSMLASDINIHPAFRAVFVEQAAAQNAMQRAALERRHEKAQERRFTGAAITDWGWGSMGEEVAEDPRADEWREDRRQERIREERETAERYGHGGFGK